ncbi:hypothetical protein TYRP_017257 [Tyrophagus putrescentiae]|nr:hypothetical protein TYRP_017257 [Tyrophagus putrescentiae]
MAGSSFSNAPLGLSLLANNNNSSSSSSSSSSNSDEEEKASVGEEKTAKYGFPSANGGGDGGKAWATWKRASIRTARLARHRQKQQPKTRQPKRQQQHQQPLAVAAGDTSGRRGREPLKMRLQAVLQQGTEANQAAEKKVYRVVSGPGGEATMKENGSSSSSSSSSEDETGSQTDTEDGSSSSSDSSNSSENSSSGSSSSSSTGSESIGKIGDGDGSAKNTHKSGHNFECGEESDATLVED